MTRKRCRQQPCSRAEQMFRNVKRSWIRTRPAHDSSIQKNSAARRAAGEPDPRIVTDRLRIIGCAKALMLTSCGRTRLM